MKFRGIFISRLLGLAGVLLASVAFASAVTVVSVKPAVELEQGKREITLFDLVSGENLSRTAMDKFREVRLADAPEAGETRTFTDVGLADLFEEPIASIHAATGETIHIRYPSRVTISRKKERIGRAEVEKEILRQLRAQCADCIFKIKTLTLPETDPKVAALGWSVRVAPELPKGGFSYPLDIVTAGASNTLWVTGTLSIEKRAPVAARIINIGEKIQAGDFGTEMRDITFATDSLADAAELEASVSARQIPAGQVIWRSSLRKELAVKFGDAVKVTAGSDDWEISMDGIAQNAGYLGENVRVKIPRTQKIISGILKEKGRVVVQ